MLAPLKKLLIQRAAHLHNENRAALLKVESVWKEVRGQYITQNSITKPTALYKGVLTITCGSREEAAHLKLQSTTLQKTINKKLKKNLIQSINLKT
jgi:predicted nucleic acid-binding Zn ribbon protein